MTDRTSSSPFGRWEPATLLAACTACSGSLVACASPQPPPLVVDVAPPAVASSPPPVADQGRPAPQQVAGGAVAVVASKTRRVKGQGYHYEVPMYWEDVDASRLGSALIRNAQRSTRSRGGFAQNVNIAAEPYVGDGPAYGSANAVELVRVSTIRRQTSAAVGPRKGWDIEASWPNQGGVPYVTLQRYGTNGTTGFVITCSTAESVFSDERAACDAILDTFRVE